jgi:hypothetical protein
MDVPWSSVEWIVLVGVGWAKRLCGRALVLEARLDIAKTGTVVQILLEARTLGIVRKRVRLKLLLQEFGEVS